MTATANKIETALQILNHHDWYWCMADYTNPSYGNAYGSMRAFVELVATIEDCTIVKALRDLWTVTHDYIHKTMWHEDAGAKAKYEAKKAELMAITPGNYTGV